MSFTANRFDALFGSEGTEVDKLGNVKPKEKKESDKPPTRRDLRRTGQRQPAVSPPSRRDRGNRREESTTEETPVGTEFPRSDRPPRGEYTGRGRQYDRHSGTGIRDNEKKIKQGWGEAGTSEFQGAHDSLNPNDPDAEERRKKFNNDEADDNTKTLGEYLSERKSQPVRLPEARKANEGSSDDQWKGAVALEKKEDAYFVGKAHKK